MKIVKGFTLIEMLIALAMISILATIAYPSYQSSVIKSRRADAQAALLGFAQAMERYYTTHGSYMGAGTTSGNTGAPTIYATKSPLEGSDVYYNLTIESVTVNTYILKADPVNAQATDGELLLKSNGARGWDSDNASGVESDEWCWKNTCS